MGYTGLAFGLGSLVGDVYIINLIGGATEIVSYCIAFLVIPGGRKKVYVVLLAVGGTSLIISAVVQDLYPSKLFIACVLCFVCLYCTSDREN